MSKEKKGLFGKLLDLVSEEQAVAQPEVQKETSAKAEGVPTQVLDFESSVPDRFRAKAITTDVKTIKGSFNEEFYNHLQAEIKKNDLDGTDYYEFRKTYEVLSKSMPEVAALNASFQALSATAPEFTVEVLLSSADFYLDLINKEHEGFDEQFNDKITTEIVGRETAIEDAITLQKEKEAQIDILNQEIADAQIEIENLTQEKLLEENKLHEVKANWDYTIELVKNNINTDVSNIKTYLVEANT